MTVINCSAVWWKERQQMNSIRNILSEVSFFFLSALPRFRVNLDSIYITSINILCLSFCLFFSNKSHNYKTNRAHIFCVNSHDPRKWMIKKFKNFIVIKFRNSTTFLIKSANFFVLFYNVYKKKMFTIEIKVRAHENLVSYTYLTWVR